MSSMVNALSFWRPCVTLSDTDEADAVPCIDSVSLNLRVSLVAPAILIGGGMLSASFVGIPPITAFTLLHLFRRSGLMAQCRRFERRRADSTIAPYVVEKFPSLHNPSPPATTLLWSLAKSPEALEKLLQSSPNFLKNLQKNSVDLFAVLLEQFKDSIDPSPDNPNASTLKLLVEHWMERKETERLKTSFKRLIEAIPAVKYISQRTEIAHLITQLLGENGITLNALELEEHKKSLKNILLLDNEELLALCIEQTHQNLRKDILLDLLNNPIFTEDQSLIPTTAKMVALLLECGASLPSEEEMKRMEHKLNPVVMRMILQARSQEGSKRSKDFPRITTRLWQLTQPAISDSRTYQTCLSERIGLVALPLIWGTAYAASFSPLSLLFGCVLTGAYAYYENKRTVGKLNELALERFTARLFPDTHTMDYLLKNPQPLEDAIFKLDEEGDDLLGRAIRRDRYRDFESLSDCYLMLAQNDLSLRSRLYDHLRACARQNNTDYLRHLLARAREKGLNDFTPSQIAELYLDLGNPREGVTLLKTHFDLNGQDDQDRTVLRRALDAPAANASLIETLLQCGARVDPQRRNKDAPFITEYLGDLQKPDNIQELLRRHLPPSFARRFPSRK